MPCQNDRAYITDSAAITPVPPVPNSPDDWGGVQRLLQDLAARAQQAIVRPSTLQQPALLNTPRTGALPAPDSLTASGAGPISLDWAQYADVYLDSFSFFKVYRSATVNNIEVASIVAITPATRFVDSNLVVSTTYYYWVAGVTKEGIEGVPSTVSASFTGFGSTYLADLAVTTAKLADLAVTGAKIEAASVTEAKINVGQLSAISADLGTITAGVITGATLQTAASGQRVTITSSTGLRAYDSGGVLQTAIYTNGIMQTSSIFGLTDVLTLQDAAATGFIKIANGEIELNVSSTQVAYFDGTDFVLNSNLKYGSVAAIGIKIVTGYITVKDSGGTTRYLAVVS